MPGNDTGHPPTDMGSTPADVFALIGHEIRAEIIGVLGDPDGGAFEQSFGEVRSRLSTDIEPSQLHYHLQQLVGHFVAKSDDGYHLRPAGVHLCWALRAGTFDRYQEHLSVNTDVDCHDCQAPVKAIFDNGTVTIECPDCDVTYGWDLLDFPLEPFEDEAAVITHLRKYMILKAFFVARGVCPNCAHPLSPEFQSHTEHSGPRKVRIQQSCDLCGVIWTLSVGRALLADPGLIAFCYDHGVDVFSTPYWKHEFIVTDNHLTVRSTDPWEVALEVTFDGDKLELVVDGDLNVLERNRRSESELGQITLPDKTACLEALRNHRWPEGVTCPHCDSADTIKKGRTAQDLQRYRCNGCNSRFNDLTGTVFADRNLSLPEMFHIIRAVEEPDPAQIARQIDRSDEPIVDFMNTVLAASDAEADVDLPAVGTADELYVTVDEHRES